MTKGAHPTTNVTIAVDTAKNVFEIAISPAAGQIRERRRMTRHQFERFWSTHEPCRVVMDPAPAAAAKPAYTIVKQTKSRWWEVRDPDDELVCLTV